MALGIVQSAGRGFVPAKAFKNRLIPDTAGDEEILWSSRDWTGPACAAYHRAECGKAVIDDAAKVGSFQFAEKSSLSL